MLQVAGIAEQHFYFLLAQNDGEALLAPGPFEIIIGFLSPQHLFIIEFDGIDPLVLLACGYFFVPDQIKKVLFYLCRGNVTRVLSLEMPDEIPEAGEIGFNGILAVFPSDQEFEIFLRNLREFLLHFEVFSDGQSRLLAMPFLVYVMNTNLTVRSMLLIALIHGSL